MIFLLHRAGKIFIKATKDEKDLFLQSRSLTNAFWDIAEKYPEELIIWKDESVDVLTAEDVENCFAHELIMASYAMENQVIPDQIGYIDQLPFVNPEYDVVYPTWRMSTDIGGIYGKTAIRFRKVFKNIRNFGYLLNSIAKSGQQNGLFCYSEPGLVKITLAEQVNFNGSIENLFRFVGQHYKKEWLWVLFFCVWRHEKRFPVFSLFKGLNTNSFFQINIDLPVDTIEAVKARSRTSNSIDVVVPTLFRAEHVENLLKDLREQTKKPGRVIIVEQDPNPESASKLEFLKRDWEFEIIHHFIHETGACNARNLAMRSVNADYIFFADDDIRLGNDLLEKTLEEMSRLGINCINLNCLQPGEQAIFNKIKQWGAFGSGTSVVRSDYAAQCRFSEFLEKGFGEDIDFGLQLRAKGCDIIYHPRLRFLHLKAGRGGFREVIKKQHLEREEPKPSPTMMYLVKSSYNRIMQKGYKASLFLKFYKEQQVKNPFRYFEVMQKRWKLSEEQSQKLQKKESLQ